MAQHEVRDQALRKLEQVTHASGDDRLDVRVVDDVSQGVRKILEDDDGLGGGVLELVAEFARRVQRIHVNDHQACAEDAGHRHRVLQARSVA